MSISRILDSNGKVDNGYFLIPASDDTITTPIVGVIDGSTANAGEIGEFRSSIVQVIDAIDITTSNRTSILSLSLTPGRWLVYGQALIQADTVMSGIFTIDIDDDEILTPTISYQWDSQNTQTQIQILAFQATPIVINTTTPRTVVLSVRVSEGDDDIDGLKASGVILGCRIG